jgi:hypothetical protein
MPQGIIISSGSTGAKQEDADAVLIKHFGEDAIDRPDPNAEPLKDAFETEEEFSAAHEEWKAKQAEAEGAEVEEDDEELGVTPQPKKKSKFTKRVEKVARQIADRENADLRKRLEVLEGGKEKPEVKAKAEENPRPKRADFKADEEYEDALISWGHKKAAAEESVRTTQEREKELLAGFLEHYEEDKERALEEHEDFTEAVQASKVVIHPAVQMAIYECEKPADVVYYLAKNPDYAEKLREMTPLSAVKEVGRLEAKLAAASGKPGSGAGDGEQRKPKPQLPAPIRPVSTAATASTLTSRAAAQKGDFAGFKAARRAGR